MIGASHMQRMRRDLQELIGEHRLPEERRSGEICRNLARIGRGDVIHVWSLMRSGPRFGASTLSASGPFETSSNVRYSVAFGGKADVARS